MVSIHNLGFGYSKKKPVFEGLNLELQTGNVYGLLGRNGAGKSSLLRNIAGLLTPTSGQCIVNGHTPHLRQPKFLQELFFLPEELHIPPISMREFVSVYAVFYPNFSQNQLNEYLKEFEVDSTARLTELSLGQKKKALISFALATNTPLLIMDEPTNGLDIPSKSQFRKIIASSITNERVILISTHQVRDLESLIDPIIIMDNREVLLNAGTDVIAEKLSFKTVQQVTNHEKVLYSEHSIRGFGIVIPNEDESYTKVDLELLFNAALEKPQVIKQLFN